MRETLRNRFIELNLPGEQAKGTLLGLSRAIGASDGHYLSDDDFEGFLLAHAEENRP